VLRATAPIDLCPSGEIQTMSHIVNSCPLTKLSQLHSADDNATFIDDQLWLLIMHMQQELLLKKE